MIETSFAITVVIPTLGESTSITELLNSLAQQKVDFQFEVLLIDNSLSSDVYEKLTRVVSHSELNIRLIKTAHKGVNFARNIGISESRAEILFFADDDCWVSDRLLLAKHFRFHYEDAECFAIGGYYALESKAGVLDKYYHEIQMVWLQKGIINIQTNETKYLIGGHCSLKKSLILNNAILFDEAIIYGGSELTLFSAAYRKKLRMRLENLSLVHSSQLTFKVLVKKLFKQGQGKAYLLAQESLDNQIIQESDTNITSSQESSLNKFVLYILNLFFWAGFYQKKGRPFAIFPHVIKNIFGKIQHKRFQALKKIEDQIQEKKNRGDRL